MRQVLGMKVYVRLRRDAELVDHVTVIGGDGSRHDFDNRPAWVEYDSAKHAAVIGQFRANDCLEVSDEAPATPPKVGVYMASKTVHAPRWRALRQAGLKVVSTWIDEAGPGESPCMRDLWRRSIAEASSAAMLIAYHEAGETPKGALVEVGAALAAGVPVLWVGPTANHSVTNHHGVVVCETLEVALATFNASEAVRATGTRGANRPGMTTNEWSSGPRPIPVETGVRRGDFDVEVSDRTPMDKRQQVGGAYMSAVWAQVEATARLRAVNEEIATLERQRDAATARASALVAEVDRLNEVVMETLGDVREYAAMWVNNGDAHG